MKKQLFFLCIISAGLLSAVNCVSQENGGRPTVAKTELVPLDLSGVGIKAVIQAPKDATAKNVGGIVISDEQAFAIRVEEVNTDTFTLAAIRKEAEEADLNRLKRYVVNTDSAALYEIFAMGERIEYHLHAIVTVKGKYYHFYNDRGLGRYSEENAVAMYNAIKGIVRK
jgi:hypothetical protein